MRLSSRLILAAGLVFALQESVILAQSLKGPAIGFIPNAEGTVISPVIGVPGASALAAPILLDVNIRAAVVSPKQASAIAVRAEDGQVVVVDLENAAVRPIASTLTAPDAIAISPEGSAAALYDRELSVIQVIGGFPGAPRVLHDFDASPIPGRAAGMAVSDDGALVLVRSAGDDGSAELWVIDMTAGLTGVSWRVAVEHPSAAAFLPGRRDAIVADEATASAFLLLDVAGAGARMPLISSIDGVSSFSSVASSQDGRRVVLAENGSGAVVIVGRDGGVPVILSCQCRPTGLYPMGDSLFRLTEVSGGLVTVLDLSRKQPQTFVIPPYVSMAQVQ